MNIADLNFGFGISGLPVRSSHTLATDADAEFSALVERQSRFAFRVAYAVLLNSSDAEDAVQETFLKLYRNRGWKQAKNERAYLARVVWRIALDLKRHLSRLSSGSSDSIQVETYPTGWPNPEEELESSNKHADVHALIDSLSEDFRVPLVLSTFDELNSREIGEILGIPEGTVRTRLQRARELLRQKLISLRETRYA